MYVNLKLERLLYGVSGGCSTEQSEYVDPDLYEWQRMLVTVQDSLTTTSTKSQAEADEDKTAFSEYELPMCPRVPPEDEIHKHSLLRKNVPLLRTVSGTHIEQAVLTEWVLRQIEHETSDRDSTASDGDDSASTTSENVSSCRKLPAIIPI